MLKFYISWQGVLWLMLLVHDWVPMYPLNDLRALRRTQTISQTIIYTGINVGACSWALIETVRHYRHSSLSFPYDPWCIYAIMTIGTILSWWVPYLFGSSKQHQSKMKPYQSTHSFLPKCSSNIHPNTMHVIVHVFIWVACALGFYLWF